MEINGEWYIFYHRHTNNTWYSRQGCAEKIEFREDGSIKQAEITSCGLNGGPLRDTEVIPAYIACHLFNRDMLENPYLGQFHAPHVSQDGKDGDRDPAFIANIHEGTVIGFKYIDFKGVSGITLEVRGYGNGTFEVRTSIDGEVLAEIPVNFMTVWKKYTSDCKIPDGVSALYLTYKGGGDVMLRTIECIHE